MLVEKIKDRVLFVRFASPENALPPRIWRYDPNSPWGAYWLQFPRSPTVDSQVSERSLAVLEGEGLTGCRAFGECLGTRQA